jgi:glucose-6-phosphate 1-dehydrogenase
VIQFRRTPFVLFRNTAVKNLETNRLVIHIQPDEGISLSFGAKVSGSVMRLGLVNMDFDYKSYFGAEHGTGYERLLRDCMAGDATLFNAPTWWRRAGALSSRLLTFGTLSRLSAFRTMPRAPGVRRRPP